MSRITEVLSTDPVDAGRLDHATIGGSALIGYDLRTEDGKPAALALVDESGHIVASGPQVATEAWIVAVLAYQRFLMEEGRMRVVSSHDHD